MRPLAGREQPSRQRQPGGFAAARGAAQQQRTALGDRHIRRKPSTLVHLRRHGADRAFRSRPHPVVRRRRATGAGAVNRHLHAQALVAQLGQGFVKRGSGLLGGLACVGEAELHGGRHRTQSSARRCPASPSLRSARRKRQVRAVSSEKRLSTPQAASRSSRRYSVTRLMSRPRAVEQRQGLCVVQAALRARHEQPHHRSGGQGAAQSTRLQAGLDLQRHRHGFFGVVGSPWACLHYRNKVALRSTLSQFSCNSVPPTRVPFPAPAHPTRLAPRPPWCCATSPWGTNATLRFTT